MRFIETTPQAIGEEPDDDNSTFKTKWWLDTARPIKEGSVGALTATLTASSQKYVAVQTMADKNPNDFVKHEKLFLLFNDQAEYYAVCENCYYTYRHMQWSGGTRNRSWRHDSQTFLVKHSLQKGWCQFCDPVFGNGGWVL